MNAMQYTHDDPPWIDQRLEDGFWDDRDMRIWYIEWLGELLGCKSLEDWYKVKTGDFENNYGATFLREYGDSMSSALRDLYPDYEWIPWFFVQVPNRFWQKSSNQRKYMDWLSDELGDLEPENWYGINKKLFEQNHGSGLLAQFGNSAIETVRNVYPEYKLLPWKFKVCPNGFWLDDAKIRTYLEWLGEELGYSKPKHWYKLSSKLMKANYGTSLLGNIWHGAARKAAYFLFPDYDWKPWLFNQVPANWWKKAENRKEYLQWLGEKLGYSEPVDWYKAKKATFANNNGSGFLKEFDGYQDAVMQSFPDFDWNPQLFTAKKNRYWDDWKNRRACVDALGEKLNFTCREDWYKTKQSDFKKNDCGGIIHYFKGSIRAILKDAYPEYEWLPWKFHSTTRGFWKDRENRIWYLKWLGKKLTFSNPEHWYKIKRRNFFDNYGGALLNHWYHGSPIAAAQEMFPDYDWIPWFFLQVPRGFWLSDENCRDYMAWLEKQLGYTKPEHWYKVKRPDFHRNYGGGFMTLRQNSPLLAVMYLYPDFPWEPEKFRRGLRAQKALLDCVMKLYPESIVKFNYMHPEMRFSGSNWKMEFDVFLPELALAFEYQGEGHYKPVSIWGGEEGLKVVQALDEQKRRACGAKNLTLIEVPYWWDRSEAELKKMIEAAPGPAGPVGSN